MKVSCICPTFARAYLLEEAVYSFLQQDYTDDHELIICNDMPQQTIVFDHPNIKVINLDSRCASLGEKRNISATHATGDMLLTWGDDDIHLPHRISRMVRSYTKQKCHHIIREGPFFCLSGKELRHEIWSPAGACMINKESYWNCGGIPLINTGEDQAMLRRMQDYFKLPSLAQSDENPAFIYRWSGSNRHHISGLDKKTGWQLMEEQAVDLIKKGQEPSGKYTLVPKWQHDYQAMVNSGIVPKSYYAAAISTAARLGSSPLTKDA